MLQSLTNQSSGLSKKYAQTCQVKTMQKITLFEKPVKNLCKKKRTCGIFGVTVKPNQNETKKNQRKKSCNRKSSGKSTRQAVIEHKMCVIHDKIKQNKAQKTGGRGCRLQKDVLDALEICL